MQPMIFVGIDPGKTGAIAYCSTTGKHGVVKMPDTYEAVAAELTPQKLRYTVCANHSTFVGPPFPVRYILEQVHASPQMGVSGAFNFGQNYGMLQAFICSNHYELVTPQKWQAALNCRTQGDKGISLARAQELFPSLKITKQTADALLIAYYGYLKYGKV